MKEMQNNTQVLMHFGDQITRIQYGGGDLRDGLHDPRLKTMRSIIQEDFKKL